MDVSKYIHKRGSIFCEIKVSAFSKKLSKVLLLVIFWPDICRIYLQKQGGDTKKVVLFVNFHTIK